MRRWSTTVCAGLATALLVPAVGAAADGVSQLQITPARVGVGTPVVARFAQPERQGLVPGERIVETLELTGPTGGGCVGDAEQAVTLSAPGTMVRQTLAPARLAGGEWCLGVHHVALTLARYSTCTPGPKLHFCPQYVVVPTTVATASFRVTRRR